MALVASISMVAAGCASEPATSSETLATDAASAAIDESTSSSKADTTVAQSAPSDDAPDGMYAACDTLTFDLIDGNVSLDHLPSLDLGATAALDFAETQGPPSGYERSQFDWRIGKASPERIELLGIPITPTATQYATAAVLRDGDAFRTIAPGVGAMGYCNMTVKADGWSHASLTSDPSKPTAADQSTLTVLATESACASGRTPPPADVYSRVDESESEIRILVMVKNAGGGQTCQSNPSFPIDVRLDGPVGTRIAVDASVIPANELQ